MQNVCLLFPGQGSQYVGMGQSFFHDYKPLFEEASDILNFPLHKIMFEGPIETLTQTQIAQPALLLHSYVAFRFLSEQYPITPRCALGHSLGEYSALVASKVLDFASAIVLVHKRGLLMSKACSNMQTAMAAVLGMDIEVLKEVLLDFADVKSANYAAIANYNGQFQTVIAGTKEGIVKAKEALQKKGAKRIIDLNVSAPFHCGLMDPVAKEMASILKDVAFLDPIFPVVSNISAVGEVCGKRLKELMIEQIANPVRFTQCAEYINHTYPNTLYVELGAKTVLSGLVKKIVPDAVLKNIDSFDAEFFIPSSLF